MEGNDINFKQIDGARKILGLGESATLREIKKAYRDLSKKYHPDRCGKKKMKECDEKMKEINNAYKVLTRYCESYRYSFGREDVKDFYSKYMKSFAEDWMWSPVKIKERRKNDHRGI